VKSNEEANFKLSNYILSIDQGTTGTTAILWDKESRSIARVNYEHKQYYPRPGWVEHDAAEIWKNVQFSAESVLKEAGITADKIAAVGITNQRETLVFWDRRTGEPVSRAIVWQCRRTADFCARLKEDGMEEMVRSKTGLLLDPYFSGTKLKWALENEPRVARAASEGNLACGTIDSYLLFRMTGGAVFATDYSNASRTLLYNINELKWDDDLLDLFSVPVSILPEVKASSTIFGETDPASFLGRRITVGGIAGDQQSALFGQACYKPGMTKNTYGTGSFLLMNTGDKPVHSSKGLLTTIAWGLDEKVEYALEGSIFITGAAVQWLRDGLGIISKSSELELLAAQAEDNGGVYLVPAFAGLGAPHWDPYARGLLIGITGGTSKAHLARAVVEAMAYQTRDVLDLMYREAGLPILELRVDGGASVMDLLLQFQADVTGTTVRRAATFDTTALGAAYLAGLACGFWESLDDLAGRWKESAVFEPVMNAEIRTKLCAGWDKAVKRSLKWADPDE
jgi:glycerol kinase